MMFIKITSYDVFGSLLILPLFNYSIRLITQYIVDFKSFSI